MDQTENPGVTVPPRRLTAREAARELGVTERTIYRRLKAGKLRHDTLRQDSKRHDDTRVSPEHSAKSEVQIQANEVKHNQIPDSPDHEIVMTLRHELEQKDNQIRALIEAQAGMTQTIQRLQDQTFELARLVLLQQHAPQSQQPNTVAVSTVAAPLKDQPTQHLDIRQFLSRLFRGKTSRDRDN